METASSSKSSNRCTNSSTSSSSCSVATREPKRNGVTGPRTPSDVHHDAGKVLHAYKLMRIDQKQKIYRIFGICKEHPTYNVTSVEDRRLTATIPTIYNKKKSVPTDFHLPKFTIDVNYRVIPPKREFSITGLNDNVDERFLHDLCKKGEEPCEIVVLYDPHTRKHLGMAFMDFDAKWKSDAFIAKHNGKAMMGSVITCFFDPMAYKISRIYEEITGTALELPKRYFDLKSTKAITDMRRLLHQRYFNEKETCPHFSYNACTSIERDKEIVRNLDPLQRRESDGDTVDDNHNSQTYRPALVNGCTTPVNDRTPPAPTFTPMPAAKTPKSSEGPYTSSNAFFCQNGGDSPSDTPVHDDGRVYSHKPSAATSHVSKRGACDKDSHVIDSAPSLETSSMHKPKSASKRTTGVKRNHRTHRWSSSSESGSSDNDESRLSFKAKRFLSKLNDLPQQHHQRNKNTPGSSSVVSTPQPPSFQTSSPLMTSRHQQQTRAGELRRVGSPHASYLNNHLNDGLSSKCGMVFSPAPPGITTVIRLPPPGIIESPSLASGVTSSTRLNIANTPSSSSQFSEFSPTKARNLEQRLVQIFGKGLSSNSQGTPSTNTPTSSSSSCAPLSIVAAAAAATAYYHQPPSTSIAYDSYRQYDVGQPSFTAYVPPAERRNKSQAEIESDLQKRIHAEQIRERQEKMLRCCDTARKVRSVMSMDLFIIMKKDLFRRLDSEAFKLLDAEIEEQKKHQANNVTLHQEIKVEKPASDNSRLMSIFPHFDNVDDTNMDSIFGMPYTVRMSAMPSFKKKARVEVKKFPTLSLTKNRTINNESHKFEMKNKEKNVEKHKESARERSLSVESDLSRSKHRRHEKKERAEKKKNKHRHRRSRSQSGSTCATADDSMAETSKVAEDGFDEEMKEKPVSSGNVSPRASSSEPDEEKDDDDVTVEDDVSTLMDEREKRLRDAEIGAQEESDGNAGKKSLSEKRAILNSLLRDSTTSNEQTPPVEDVIVEIVAADPAKLVQLNKVNKVKIDQEEEEETVIQTNEESDAESTQGEVPFIAAQPPSSKRPRFERQLNSLLNGSVFTKPPKPTAESRIWSKRSENEELGILNDLQETPINEEDCAYLKVAFMRLWDYFDEMMPDDRKLIWIQPTIPRVPQELPSKVSRDNCEFYYDDPELDGVVPHKTGCARTEGYYKVSRQRKRLLRRFDNEMVRTVISTQDETAVRHKTQATKDERAMNRRLKTWIGDSNLIRVNQLKYRGKMIKFARSRIHGWGLYALENILPEEMIIEYVGEKIRPTVADEREKNYERRGMGSSYMFRIDGDAVIDATKKGNYGRFINHSCMPNCTARVVMVDGEKRIVIYSKRLIQRGEEITYDYKFAREDEASKIECLCGARTCHKYLN